ncbi:MAG: hypothetical protein K5762_08175 [Bacilli bacterium]|nr:hypothetical protein [Bacilli bacterium]
MNYFTKDYVLKKRSLTCLEGFESIPSQTSYSDQDIDKYYGMRLMERIKQAEEDFNTPIKPMESREDIIANYDEKKYPMYDLVTQRIIGYHSLEDVLKSYDDQVLRQQELFEKRGEFNPDKVINAFKWDYQYELNKKFSIPKEFLDKLDKRLLALHYMPSDIYLGLQYYINQARDYVLRIDNMEKRCLSLDKYPADIKEYYLSPRAEIIALTYKDNLLTFTFYYPGIVKAGFTSFRQFTFKNAQILSYDEDLPFKEGFHRIRNYPDAIKVLHTEVYPVDQGYENHVLFENKEGMMLEMAFRFDGYEMELNY